MLVGIKADGIRHFSWIPVWTKAWSCRLILYLDTKTRNSFGWSLGYGREWRRMVSLYKIIIIPGEVAVWIFVVEYRVESGGLFFCVCVCLGRFWLPATSNPRDIWQYLENFWFSELGRCCWYLMETRVAAKHSAVHRTKHHNKELSNPKYQ